MHISLPDGRNYPINIGTGLIDEASNFISSKRVIIITDTNVGPIWLDRLTASLKEKKIDSITIPAGESSKSFKQLEEVLEKLLSLKPDRKTTLIALGGGVIGDITGFAASILLRGVPFIQIPTSLLAQVDSSVGGKTGINSSYGKNLIGSFYQPKAVIIDTNTLKTLPAREVKAGLAEVIKAACIESEDFFKWLEHNCELILNKDPAILNQAITESVKIKADVVIKDEKESGVRALLNLGHTFAHAIETEYEYDGRINHGEAVAIGISMAFSYCSDNNVCSKSETNRVIKLINKIGLPVNVPKNIKTEAIVRNMQNDKKAKNEIISLILPNSIGSCFIKENVKISEIVDFINNYRQVSR